MNKIVTRTFAPNWVSSPGETIADILAEKNLSETDLAIHIGRSLDDVKKLLCGQFRITAEIARQLGMTFGMSENFWIARESQYRDDLKRVHAEEQTWLSEMPFKDMVRFGWVEPSDNKIGACLNFFGVSDMMEWQKAYQNVFKMTAFRTSPSFKSEVGAVAAWLRQGEILSEGVNCKPWNPKSFGKILPKIRQLTRKRNPSFFISELQKSCSECGVAVIVLRAPEGCRASGATRFLSAEKASLLLSFRYLSDDHFWFTFFHEVGHLLMHGKKSLFLEGASDVSTKEEQEANEFATEILIPREFRDELLSLNADTRQIVRFARRIGISPGIVVGQLQHIGRIKRSHFNGLKARFEWAN